MAEIKEIYLERKYAVLRYAVIQAQLLNLFIDLEWNQREIIELQKQQIETVKE